MRRAALDAVKVEAKLRDGVLTVRLPKAESHKPKKIKVMAAYWSVRRATRALRSNV